MIAFSGNPLDRAGEKRSDADWLLGQRASPAARVLLLSNLRPLLMGSESAEMCELQFLDGARASEFGLAGAVEVFLGLDGDVPYFARDVSESDGERPLPAGLGHFREARAAAAVLPLTQVAILGQAKALLDWHERNSFCARCGAKSGLADGGYRRICPVCKTEHFPRTDPAVIMLVTAGEHCLLGRNKRFAGGFYSTLAGFVDPGETIEEAVIREVREEVGVRVGRVRYFASQPWPFPSSLMIGCFAEADTHEITVDGNEILAARWIDRSTVRKLIAGESKEIGIPRRDAIAFHLIRTWAEEE